VSLKFPGEVRLVGEPQITGDMRQLGIRRRYRMQRTIEPLDG
jgi:hypothetical protein